MVSFTKSRSRRKGLPFDLTPEHVLSLIPADGLCPAIGIPIVFGKKLNRSSPSIDRVIPALGYVIGNVRVISHRANSMKQDCTKSDELRRVADYMDRHSQPPVEESRVAHGR